MRLWFSKSAGFSLIEILVSLLIFTVVLLGVARGYLLVSHQLDVLYKEKMVGSLVHELVQRQYRNPSELYFKQSIWDSLRSEPQDGLAAMLTCEEERCLESDLRDYDIRWFQAQVQLHFDEEQFSIKPCVEQQFLCLEVIAQHDVQMEFVVSSDAR